jgi:DNA-binding transcriptional regulator PaaX
MSKSRNELLQNALLGVIAVKPGKYLLNQLVEAFDYLEFKESAVRKAIRDLERQGRIRATWDWTYEPTET